MKEIRAAGLADRARIEIGLRLVGSQHLNPRDRAKARAVIKAESFGDAIQLAGLDDPQRRTGRARHRLRCAIAGAEDACYGMVRWRLIRKTRANGPRPPRPRAAPRPAPPSHRAPRAPGTGLRLPASGLASPAPSPEFRRPAERRANILAEPGSVRSRQRSENHPSP